MIKFFCDICGKEIESTEDVADLKFSKWRITATGTEKVQVVELYCSGCRDKILEKIEEMRKK